ncbi:MAG TPA: phosphoribosyltransferase family protein [Candidatus Paceibacterota bacterium]|jgi:orotate phosphoribosyltransferase|nr:phosphoribosyltransferase family protein [Candidatus Paceibacterota bacterium]
MKDVVKILKSVGGIIENNHFVGTSGRHLSAYVNKDALLPHTKKVSEVSKLFAEKFKNKKIEVVVSPAVAGIPFSTWTANHLSKMNKREVLSVFTEKTIDNNQIFKRGYDTVVKNKRVLVIEDTTATGSSVKKVISSVKKAGGKVVGVVVMINRDPKLINSKTIGAPFFSLSVLKLPSYDTKNCPMCKKGVPMNTQLGHGKKFLQEN